MQIRLLRAKPDAPRLRGARGGGRRPELLVRSLPGRLLELQREGRVQRRRGAGVHLPRHSAPVLDRRGAERVHAVLPRVGGRRFQAPQMQNDIERDVDGARDDSGRRAADVRGGKCFRDRKRSPRIE